jgi:hypothetical protein
MQTYRVNDIIQHQAVGIASRGKSWPVARHICSTDACGDSGFWAHGQVLDAIFGCSSRNYLYGLVTASLDAGELRGGCRNRLPHPLNGSLLRSKCIVIWLGPM